MSRRAWTILGVAILLALGTLVGVAFFWPRPLIGEATSPDGTWSVRVSGIRHFDGQYEIVVKVLNGRGETAPGGSFVVGIVGDWAHARRHFAPTFLDETHAKVGNRTIDKSRYFR